MKLSAKRLEELANVKSMGAFIELCLHYKLNATKALEEVAKYRKSLKKGN